MTLNEDESRNRKDQGPQKHRHAEASGTQSRQARRIQRKAIQARRLERPRY
jgi:hypothetical protein